MKGSILVSEKNGAKVKLNTPNNMLEVRTSQQVEKWIDSIRSEMDGMHEKGVLTPVRKEKGMRVIPTRFVFKIKTNEVG